MVTISRPSDYGSRITETTAFIQCLNGQELQINKLWCHDLDGIWREVHPTAHAEILAGTVREFVNDYLAENGRQIMIIGELSINRSVHFLGFSDQAWVIGLPYIVNLWAQVEAIGWGSSNYPNKIWGGRINNANRIINAACVLPSTPVLLMSTRRPTPLLRQYPYSQVSGVSMASI